MKAGSKIVVLGSGESGTGAAILARLKGFDVFVSDRGLIKEKYKQELNENQIPFEEGQHTESVVRTADLIIKSPGIPDNAPVIKWARESGVSISSEIEFAGSYTSAKIIGITGTNGKTTTTLLTYHILKKAGLNVGLAGNVGYSFARQVAENSFEYFVIELSSFQLDGMSTPILDIGVLLNITPDHLDRYNYDLNQYVSSKMRLSQLIKKGGAMVYCIDDELIRSAMKQKAEGIRYYPFSLQKIEEEGACLDHNEITINIHHNPISMSIHDLALQGKHNAYNSMASAVSARVLEIRKEIIRESLSDFVNIEHRLEFVAKVHGIEFINDSKATNVNSSWYALESMNNPVVWIVGGQDKGNDYNMLTDIVKDKVKAIVCLGKDNAKIIKFFKNMVPLIEESSSAEEAVKKAYRLARNGDTVLLSPACASFDLFENYEDRGHQFKNAVRAL
jgi:UDP-N-acetylmuramoylalanine--D-glutamate ligase